MEGFSTPARRALALASLTVLAASPLAAQAGSGRGSCCAPDVQHSALGVETSCVWNDLTPPPASRVEAQTAEVGGLVYIFGGFTSLQLIPTFRSDVYDPATDTYTQLADMPVDVTHAGCALAGQRIYVAGGFQGQHPGTVVDEVWYYDIPTNTWNPFPSLPEARGSGQLVHLGGKLHYFGGVLSDRDTDSSAHWVYDLQNPNGWLEAAPLLPARNHHAGIAVGGKIYSLGGQFNHDTNPVDVDWMSVYDPQTDTWTALNPMPFARSHFEPSTTMLDDQRIVIVGGRANQDNAAVLPDVSVYDTTTDTWSSLPALPRPLFAPVAKVIGGELYVSGGFGPGGPQLVSRVHDIGSSTIGAQRINCGGSTSLVSSVGTEWCSDQFPINGTIYENINAPAIAGTADDELYHTERYASDAEPTEIHYRIPVTPGVHEVRLHFAEIYWGAPGGGQGGVGQRVFDVHLEGMAVLTDYDIYAAVGPLTADVHTFFVAVPDGAVDVLLTSVADRPKISGIEVLPLGEIGTSYCVGAPNSAGLGAEISVTGTTSVAANLLTLAAEGCPPGQTGLFIYGSEQAQTPLYAGFLCISGNVFRITDPKVTDVAGRASHRLDLNDPPAEAATITAGSTWNFQFWYRDTSLGTANLTDAVSVSFVP